MYNLLKKIQSMDFMDINKYEDNHCYPFVHYFLFYGLLGYHNHQLHLDYN